MLNRTLFLLIATLLLSATVTHAQSPIDESFNHPLVRITDESNRTAFAIVKADGTFFMTFNNNPLLRIESFGQMRVKGCAVVLEDIQPWYRAVIVADKCTGTGKAVVQYFGIGTMGILDKTRD